MIGIILLWWGICVCLLSGWNAIKPGAVIGCIGAVVLVLVSVVWRRQVINQEIIHMSEKTIEAIILCIVGALLLGMGMCCVLVWSQMMRGIIVGIVGSVMLLMLVPLIKGLK